MNNDEKVKMMAEKKVWAVVGATPNNKKFANMIFHTFKDYGYEVYGVNPRYKLMDDGSVLYEKIEDLPKVPDVIDYVVSPPITLECLEALDPKVYPNIWLQPGTYDDEIVKYAEEKGFTVVHEGACIMAYIKENM